MGTAQAIAAIMELPTIAGFVWMMSKRPCEFWIKFSAVFYAIKGVALWLVPNVAGVYGVALLQIVTYAILYTGTVYYVNQVMRPEDSIKGQGYVTAASTVGSIIASLMGGVILDVFSAEVLLIISAVTAVAGSVIIFFSAGNRKRR